MDNIEPKIAKLRDNLAIQKAASASDWQNAAIGDALSELPPETHVDKAIGQFTAKFARGRV